MIIIVVVIVTVIINIIIAGGRLLRKTSRAFQTRKFMSGMTWPILSQNLGAAVIVSHNT